MTAVTKPFDRPTIEQAFERLGELAFNADKIVEISVYGGSALVLTTDFRVSTSDVDALFEADRRLGTLLGIGNFDQALAHVMRYYPAGRLSPKIQFGLQEIFSGPPKTEA